MGDGGGGWGGGVEPLRPPPKLHSGEPKIKASLTLPWLLLDLLPLPLSQQQIHETLLVIPANKYFLSMNHATHRNNYNINCKILGHLSSLPCLS